MNWLRAWLIRLLGMKECGAFGGVWSDHTGSRQRWCLKPFGHSDSCAFEPLPDVPASQPGHVLRLRFRGWWWTLSAAARDEWRS